MRLARLTLPAIVATGLLTAPLAAEAQTSGTVYRVGILLTIQERYPESAADKVFVEALREHGYIVGENVVIEARSAAGKPERLPELAAELVRLKCDVILAPTTPPALALRQATTTIPLFRWLRLTWSESVSQPVWPNPVGT